MEKYTVLLVDDHKLFREGLKLLLSKLNYISEIYEASNGNEFIKIIEFITPDIIFMDIDMPEMNGIEATERGMKINKNLKIIALSMYGEDDYYSKMIDAGVKGFILKNSDISEVETAIQNIINGKNYFSQEILESIIKNMYRKKNIKKTGCLTERETEVLFNICKGLSNQEIADTLYLSKRTIDKHRENLLSKTNSKNTAELVIYAIKNGVITV
ncbi:response regulator [Bacteroidota bacterium]